MDYLRCGRVVSGIFLALSVSGGLAVKIAPTSTIGFGTGTVTTTQAMVSTVTGGTAPYTYLWTSSEPTIYPVTPSNSSAFFRRDSVISGESYSATVQLTVTDASGQTATAQGSVNITGV